MLYVTTRNSRDAYTAHRALCEMRGPDGGLYVPFRKPNLTKADVDGLLEQPFNACVAKVINILFHARLEDWDLDFAIGRSPVRLHTMGHRIIVAECWHNPEEEISYLVRKIANRIRLKGTEADLGDWPQIGVRIAILFGIFGQLQRQGGLNKPVDVSVLSGDFIAPMAAWYARIFGLPIGNIVCCCNENSAVWELFHHGEFRTGAVAVQTAFPESDVSVPVSLERLIHGCGGYSESCKYVDVLRKGGNYHPNDVILSRLRYGMDVSVVSGRRTHDTIVNVCRSQGYLMNRYTAIQYTGLQDYRSRTGETGTAIVLSERSPAKDLQILSRLTDIPEEEILKRL